MVRSSRQLRVLAFSLALLPSWWIQRAHAQPASPVSAGSQLGDHAGQNGFDPAGNGGTLTGSYVKPYCEGTGASNQGVDCPCGNVVPVGTSAGCVNRTGGGASLTPTGNPSVTNDTFLLTASGMPAGVPSFFFAGSGTGTPTAFGNGTRCIVGPLIRLRKIANSGASEIFPAPGTPPISQQLNLSAGSTSFFQTLYRDAGGPCATGANATNAVMVIWGP